MKKKKFVQGAYSGIWSCKTEIFDHNGNTVAEYNALIDRDYFEELKEQFDKVYKLRDLSEKGDK